MRNIIIFEGVELAGKSWVMSQLYPILETQGNTNPLFLNGCIWFNCDIGLLGDTYGQTFIEHQIKLAQAIPDRTMLWEKFHISDAAYRQFHGLEKISYNATEEQLLALGARIIFCRVNPDQALFEQRLADRLRLYPHYQHIAKSPADYIRLQTVYEQVIVDSKIPSLTLDTSQLPNINLVSQISSWLAT